MDSPAKQVRRHMGKVETIQDRNDSNDGCSLVSNMAEVLELLVQSSEMAVTWTSYFSPHFSMLIWQLVEADVQLREAPAPSTAVALYRLAPNTKSQVTVTVPLEQL